MKSDDTYLKNIIPYYPIYARSPNKLIKYIEEPFDDGHGHYGIKRIAIYTDKNGKTQQEIAQVLWNEEK